MYQPEMVVSLDVSRRHPFSIAPINEVTNIHVGIAYGDLQYLTGLGMAAGGANGGHDGGDVQAFAGNIEVIKDFSYRS